MSLRPYIRVDAENLEGVQTALLVYGHKGHKSLRRAINKTLGWVRSQGTHAMAAEHGLPLKVMRFRRRSALRPATASYMSGLVWFGLAPVKAVYFGTPRQTRTGTKVGGRFFEGAFVATMPIGHLGVFRRSGQSRLPIKEQTVSIRSSENALRRIAAQVPGRLRIVFRQELNYEFNVRKTA